MTLKLLTTPGERWPSVLTGNRQSEIWSAYLEITRCESLRRTDFVSGQEEQLVELLRHSHEHVPYYRERWAAGAPRGRGDLSEYPILKRRDLAENFQALLAQRLPGGHLAVGTRFSSGSTGEPVQVRKTTATELWHYAFYLRSLAWGRFASDGTFAAIRYYDPKLARELQKGLQIPSLEPALAGFLKTSPAYVMDVHVDPQAQLQWLRQVKPDYLVSYPSNLLALGRLNRESGTPVMPRRILSLSEALSESDEAKISRDFDCSVFNVYSCHEAGMLALPCPKSGGALHVCEENVLFEIVDDEGRPCLPGVEGRVLVTTLHNFATPLVRYDIGDRAAWVGWSCGCGRPHKLIERPQGKQCPLFTLPNGMRKTSMGLAAGMRALGGIRQFRITQKSPVRILVEVVPEAAGWGDVARNEVEKLLQNFLESTEINVVLAEYESRLPLRNGGKSPHLVTEVPAPAE